MAAVLRGLLLCLMLGLMTPWGLAQEFGPSVRVSPQDILTTRQHAPVAAADAAGTLYVAWLDHRNGGWEVWFSASADGGVSFSRNKKVAVLLAPPETPGSAAIAAGAAGVVAIAFTGYGNQSFDLSVVASTDG